MAYLIFCPLLISCYIFQYDLSYANTVIGNIDINNLTLFQKLLLAICATIAGIGIYLSKKQKIVVFANYTDLIFTIATFSVIAIFLYSICQNYNSNYEFAKIVVEGILGLLLLFYLVKATYLYNKSINSGIAGFILALFTKFVIISFLALFIILCIVYIIAQFVLSPEVRHKGERSDSFEKRVQRERAETRSMMAFAFSALVTFLIYTGLWNPKYICFSSYFSGYWKEPDYNRKN